MPVHIKTTSAIVHEETVHFHAKIKDERGRSIGAYARVTRVVVERDDSARPYGYCAYGKYQPGATVFAAYVQTTRNGVRYGASQRTVDFDTQAEAEAYIAKAIAAAEKRYAKKFAVA